MFYLRNRGTPTGVSFDLIGKDDFIQWLIYEHGFVPAKPAPFEEARLVKSGMIVMIKERTGTVMCGGARVNVLIEGLNKAATEHPATQEMVDEAANGRYKRWMEASHGNYTQGLCPMVRQFRLAHPTA